MSYSISLAIKEMPKENMMDFINKFKQKMLKPENAQQEIELNYIYCPYIRSAWFMEEKCNGCKKAIEELTNYWIRSLFEFKFCYIDDIDCLACVLSQESPKEICDMFDTFVYFQNSCDQDYDYKEWGDITYFKKQIEFIKQMTKEQFTKWYKENIYDFFEEEYATSDIEYYKRSAVYELCYQPIKKVIWGNDNCIIVNLLYEADYSYINYKNILKRFLIQKAEKEDWVKDYLIQCGIIKQGEKK